MVAKLTPFALLGTTLFSVLLPINALAAEHSYYDGAVKRSVQMDANNWASVEKESPNSPVTIRAASTSEKGVLQNQTTASGKREFKTLSGSPVFRDQGNGPAMALPGGVIVIAKNADLEQATKRLQARGLTVERKIGSGTALLVSGPQGIGSLDLANTLHESGEFESASPNWWRERTKK